MNEIIEYIGTTPVAVLTDEKQYSVFYERVKSEIAGHDPDVSTLKGRKDIASLAYKVTRSKTAIDDAGKKLNEEARQKINAVDAQRRKIRAELDALAAEARKPLTDWETAEEERIERCKSVIAHIEECGKGFIGGELQPFGILFRELEEKVVIDDSLGEFQAEARAAKERALERLSEAYEAHKKAEADRLELERLRKEAAEREAKEAERRAAEQAERDRVAAEEAAKRREQEAAERARDEERRLAAEALAKAEAEKRALVEKQEREERERQAAAERARREEEARAADRKHRSEVMRKAKKAIMTCGADEETAKKIVLAIIAGEVPNTTLRF